MNAVEYNVPVAAKDYTRLRRFGRVHDLREGLDKNQACILVENVGNISVWCNFERNDYRELYIEASNPKNNIRVDALEEWGQDINIDADHVVAAALMRAMKLNGWLVRIHPCWSAINRRSGGGREKVASRSKGTAEQEIGRRVGDVILAGDLQLLKMMGMDPGTGVEPQHGNW